VADQDDRNSQLKAGRAEDGKKAMADYEAQAAAVRAKTERLRALRLAREAADGPAAPKKVAVLRTSSPKSPRSRGKRQAGSLSDWLKDQERGGHRT